MTDLISREAVINLIMTDGIYCDTDADKKHSVDKIRALPSIQPKHGEWIPLQFDGMTYDFPYERDGQWVIVTNGKTISVERIKKDAYDHFYPNGRWFELDEVIAWMPLPELYKDGGGTVKEVRINLNESVRVKLTDLGKEIYYHQYDDINKIADKELCKPPFPKIDEDGYTSFQLWEFIQLYGSYIGMGFPNVIEPLEIVY